MVAVTCDIDTAAGAKLDELLRRIEREMPQRLATETRRAAIYTCESLRARTKVAPKRVRPSEWSASPSLKRPRYQFYFGKKDKEGGRSGKRDKPLRRWSLTRKFGTPDAYTKHHYVYTNAHRAKNGKMVGKSAAAERRELIKMHGGIPRAGLAKLSWGWVMKQIYNGAAAATFWKRTKGERRDPRQYVEGQFSKSSTGAFALIRNALDYIMDALKPGALAEAMDAASKRLEHNISEEIGKMTA
jgi:hypothetical protein